MPEDPFDAELKVLLIEDNPADARLVHALSAEAGNLVVTWATTLEAGLAELRRTPIDAVLLDLMLPDARGIDVIARVRTAAPHAAIIVASGQPEEDCLLARAVIRKGADDLLPKVRLTSELLARSLGMAVERARLKSAADRHSAFASRALAGAGIGFWSWSATFGTVTLAGRCPVLDSSEGACEQLTARLSDRRLLRRLPRWVRRVLRAARREARKGTDRLAAVVVDVAWPHDQRTSDLILEIAVERDGEGHILHVDGIVRQAQGCPDIERLEGEVLTHLGHELRTPLTSIRGALGVLANDDAARLTVSSSTLVGIALANANRVVEIIGEALAQGNEGSDRLGFPPRHVPLGRFLYDAVAARLPKLTTAGISLVLAPGVRARGDLVDASQLRHALDCLCRSLLAEARGAARDRSAPVRFSLEIARHDAHLWLRAVSTTAAAGCGDGARRPDGGAGRLAVALAA